MTITKDDLDDVNGWSDNVKEAVSKRLFHQYRQAHSQRSEGIHTIYEGILELMGRKIKMKQYFCCFTCPILVKCRKEMTDEEREALVNKTVRASKSISKQQKTNSNQSTPLNGIDNICKDILAAMRGVHTDFSSAGSDSDDYSSEDDFNSALDGNRHYRHITAV